MNKFSCSKCVLAETSIESRKRSITSTKGVWLLDDYDLKHLLQNKALHRAIQRLSTMISANNQSGKVRKRQIPSKLILARCYYSSLHGNDRGP